MTQNYSQNIRPEDGVASAAAGGSEAAKAVRGVSEDGKILDGYAASLHIREALSAGDPPADLRAAHSEADDVLAWLSKYLEAQISEAQNAMVDAENLHDNAWWNHAAGVVTALGVLALKLEIRKSEARQPPLNAKAQVQHGPEGAQ